MNRSSIRSRAILALGLLAAVPAMASAAPKPNQPTDLCVVRRSIYTGNALDTFVFQDVGAMRPGRTMELKGIYFTPVRIPTPFHGTAVMSSEGTIRIGILVHHSARNQFDGNIYTTDKVISGMTDADFAGILNVDYNGDSIPDGTVTLVSEDCVLHPIP